MKQRLDKELIHRKMVQSRSQAETLIDLGKILVDGVEATKPNQKVDDLSQIRIRHDETYVSRAGFKLASVAKDFKLEFKNKTVLDVGSSTGGFTDYALQHGAKHVFAVDVGTDQLHPVLRRSSKISIYEKTDIRDFVLEDKPDIIVIDVSFISLREVLPHIARNLSSTNTQIVAMLKPQFEAGKSQTNKGIIKNNSQRRQIIKDFEMWLKQYFLIIDKKDSEVGGSKGNVERFYVLRITH